MKTLTLVVICFTCFLTSTLATVAADKPNVLFIAIDDQNDWVGCMDSHPMRTTPHVAEVAGRGS